MRRKRHSTRGREHPWANLQQAPQPTEQGNLSLVLCRREGAFVKVKVDNSYLISVDKGQWMTMRDNGEGREKG
jgi:hypothetical protein